jgi:hypothetical protein
VIVRILGDAVYELPETEAANVEQLDEALGDALDRGDEPGLQAVLGQLIAHVQATGRAVPADDLRPSDLAVPHQGSTLDEVRALLASES